MMDKFKKIISQQPAESAENTFIEIKPEDNQQKTTGKIMLKHFTLNDFSDVRPVLDSLREGYTIALIKVKPLREKDLGDLKRAIFKIKRTCDAMEGELMGIDQNLVLAVPSYVSIQKGLGSAPEGQQENTGSEFETY